MRPGFWDVLAALLLAGSFVGLGAAVLATIQDMILKRGHKK